MSTATINASLARAMAIAKLDPPDQRYLDALEAVPKLPFYIEIIADSGLTLGDPKELKLRSAAAIAYLAGVLTESSEAFIN